MMSREKVVVGFTFNEQKDMNTDIKKIGTIRLGAKVRVTDPCYETSVWCSGQLDIVPGEYDCYVERTRNGIWGERIARLIIANTEHCRRNVACTEHVDFEVGVDSGQAGIFDLQYYEKNQPNEEWYQRICSITCSDKECGTIDNVGVVTCSGYGDGGYDAFVKRSNNGEIVAIEIVFIYEEDEEDI